MELLRTCLTITVFTFVNCIDNKRAVPLTCYSCPKVADSIDCTVTKMCQADEQCFTDKYISEEHDVFFSLGCKSKRICDIISSFGKRDLDVLDEREKRNIIHLCTQCCDHERCNNNLCTVLTTPKPAARCYHCAAEEDPESCVQIQTCENHQECFADVVYLASGQIRHSLGCRDKRLCEAALHHGGNLHHGKRQFNTHLCIGCCSGGEGCNHKGCYSIPHHNTTSVHG